MKNKIMLLIALLVLPFGANADVGLGEVLGTAWTIGDAIVGKTTLTPAYAVESYFHRDSGWVTFGVPVSTTVAGSTLTLKLTRSRVTGAYFYYKKIETTAGVSEWTTPFPLNSINKLNMQCTTASLGLTSTTITVDTHTEFVWLAKVESTGLWPDDGPWTVWLKTSGHKTKCVPTNTPPTIKFWIDAKVGKTGGKVVSLGTPNAILDYPFYLANDFYH